MSANAEPHGKRRLVLFASVMLTALALDQTAKQLSLTYLVDKPPQPVIGELLQLYLTFNPGAAFSIGKDYTWVFTILATIGTIVVLTLARRVRTRTWAWALGLIGGGITGNLVDRIFRAPERFQGHVVDYLMLPNWPVFNLADVSLNAGVILVIVMAFRGIRLDGTREER